MTPYSEGGRERKEDEAEEKGEEVKGGVEEGVKEEMFPTRLRSWTDLKKGESGSGDWKSIRLPPGSPGPAPEAEDPPAPPALLPALVVAPLPPAARPRPPRPRPRDEVVGELAEETARLPASQLGRLPSVGALESQLARRRSAL